MFYLFGLWCCPAAQTFQDHGRPYVSGHRSVMDNASGAAAGDGKAPAKPARERRQLKRLYADESTDHDFQTLPCAKSTREK